jgi:hypothetical protein
VFSGLMDFVLDRISVTLLDPWEVFISINELLLDFSVSSQA